MTPAQADTPAKRIYLAVQLMYTSRDPRAHHETYFSLMRELVQAAPSAWPHIETISNHILTGDMYKALEERQDAYRLREGAARCMQHAAQNLRRDREANRQSA